MAIKTKSTAGAQTHYRGLIQTIGWQRVTLQTPSVWTMVAASGDERSGSVRIEHTGHEESTDPDIPRGAEIRWSEVKQAQTAVQLDKRVQPLLTAAEKTARKAKLAAEPEIGAYEDKRHPERGAVREYSWRNGADSVVGRIWRCSSCGRLLVAQVYYRAGNRGRERAREILAGIECHNRNAGWTRWSLYGLDVEVPEDYFLSGQQLMTIYHELRFTRGKGRGAVKYGESLTVEQWSAANVHVKGAYLDEWLEKKGQALQRSLKVEKTESIVHGHPALDMSGVRTGLLYWLIDAPKSLSSLRIPARHYSAVGWECADSNKIYLIQTLSIRSGANTVDTVAARLQCHAVIPTEPESSVEAEG